MRLCFYREAIIFFVEPHGVLNVLSPMWDNMRQPSICHRNLLPPFLLVLSEQSHGSALRSQSDPSHCDSPCESFVLRQQPALTPIIMKKIWIAFKYYVANRFPHHPSTKRQQFNIQSKQIIFLLSMLSAQFLQRFALIWKAAVKSKMFIGISGGWHKAQKHVINIRMSKF